MNRKRAAVTGIDRTNRSIVGIYRSKLASGERIRSEPQLTLCRFKRARRGSISLLTNFVKASGVISSGSAPSFASRVRMSVSAIVDRSGTKLERFAVVTAIARSLLAFTCGHTDGRLASSFG